MTPILLWVQTRENSWFHSLGDHIKFTVNSESLLDSLELPLDSGSEFTTDSDEMDISALEEHINNYRKLLKENEENDKKPTNLIQEIKSLNLNS